MSGLDPSIEMIVPFELGMPSVTKFHFLSSGEYLYTNDSGSCLECAFPALLAAYTTMF